jgi:hemolysin III
MQDKRYSLSEEVFSSVTHGLGALLSIAGLAVLAIAAINRGSVRALASYGIYGLTLITLYLFSTLYHGIVPEKAKQKLRLLDHASIYLLIAGSYTPITLLYLKGAWGWSLFGIVWGLAVVGIVLKMIDIEKTKIASMVLYFLMGWMVVLAVKPMLLAVPAGMLVMLLAGGLFYTLGIIFYAAKNIPHNHGIWHLFVLAGSICHFIGYLLYEA